MRSTHQRRRNGFTLIELMIVVSIIGLLAGIAIPSFTSYQNRARRSESYVNLGSLAKAQKSYFAEFGLYKGALMVPSSTTGVNPGPKRRDSTVVKGTFDSIGWYPEGNIYFDYDTNTGGFADCNCPACFTSTAYGDVDGDGSVAMIMYTHPNLDQSNSCTSLNFPGKGIPQIRGGSTVYDEPVRVVGADDF